VDDLERVRAALYSMLEDSDRLGLSRFARLRIVAIIGDVEAALKKRNPPAAGPPDVARE